MKEFISGFYSFFKANKITIYIAIGLIFILSFNNILTNAKPDEQEFSLGSYVLRLLFYISVLFLIIVISYLFKKKQLDVRDLLVFSLNSFIQLCFNVYLIVTVPCNAIRGYDMGIVSVPFYSILGCIYATIIFFLFYILLSIFKLEKVIKILLSFALSCLVTYIYMKYFICDDTFFLSDYI